MLIYVYPPNKDKDLIEFLKILLITLKKWNLDSEDNMIMGGDFNCPLDPAIDKSKSPSRHLMVSGYYSMNLWPFSSFFSWKTQ